MMLDIVKELHMVKKLVEVPTIFKSSWSTKCMGLPSTMEHLEVPPLIIAVFKVKEELKRQILDNKITITIGQLFKLAFDMNIYFTTQN
jgi:hypothetical protein